MGLNITIIDRRSGIVSAVWLFLFLCVADLYAQTPEKDAVLNRTVVVENEYNPEIMDASKINILPAIEEPAVSPKNVEYSTGQSPASDYGVYEPMLSFADGPVQPPKYRGYAHLGYGNYGNVDAGLGYLFSISEKDQLGVTAKLGGMNGTLHLPSPYWVNGKAMDWKSYFYSSGIDLDYVHAFQKFKMNITGDFGVDNFNYHQFPIRLPLIMGGDWIYMPYFDGRQNQTKGKLQALFASSDESLPLQFDVQAGYSYFDKKYDFGEKKLDKENLITLNADLRGAVNEWQKIGLKLAMNNFSYNLKENDSYTSLEVNPYYSLNREHWRIRFGAHVNFSFGKGSVLEASPDVDIQFGFGENYALFLKATGGRILNDYRQMESVDPYWMIYRPEWWKNTYIPVDASFGLKMSPVKGARFNLFAGYQIRKNELCFDDFYPEMSSYAYSYVQTGTMKEFYAGIELGYFYKDFLDIAADATFHRLKDPKNSLFLMKPELELNLRADFKLFTSFYLNLGYEYISRHKVFHNDISSRMGNWLSEYKMNPVNNLSLGLTYNFWKGASAYVKLRNILNRDYQYYYSYPAEKLNFLAGLSVKF